MQVMTGTGAVRGSGVALALGKGGSMKRWAVFARLAASVAALLLVVPLAPAPGVAAQGRYFADPAFQRIWERNDRPVEQLITDRSWTWGPNSYYNGLEAYKQGKNQGRTGYRLVQYFDKARMEINDDTKDRDEPGFVTNGRLVAEMVAGKIAFGDKADEVEAKTPSQEAVAGDPASVNDGAPTYASFKDVASLNADRPAENRIGEKIRQRIDKSGRVRSLPSDQESLADLVKVQVFEPNLKHNIPDKFWTFLTQTGPVYENGRTIQNGSVFQPWEFVMGLPITEPYWVSTKVAGVERWVLVQLFERRVLTYTPSNRPGFEVEMGNVGQHYYRWRYQGERDQDDGAGGERPKITALERTELTRTSAKIEWATNVPTTGRLRYHTTDDIELGQVVGSREYDTEHVVELTGLTPNTKYFYRIESRDRDGRVVDDTLHSFTTPA
jgi:hypothetical protein